MQPTPPATTPKPQPRESEHGHAAIARRASLVSAATLGSRMLGFGRDLCIAWVLGAGPAADVFLAAFRAPDLMRRLFGEGTLAMAAVPVLVREQAGQGRERANAVARAAMLWLLLLGGALLLPALLFPTLTARLLAPGFAQDPALLARTAALLRIMLPYVVLIAATGLCMALLHARDRFLAPALAPVLLNVVLIGAGLAAIFCGLPPALVLAWAVLGAGVLQWLAQQPSLARAGFSWRGQASMRDPAVRLLGKRLVPAVIGASCHALSVWLGTLLATFHAPGAVSALYYADRVAQLPLGVIGAALSMAALPSLAHLAATGRHGEYLEAMAGSARLALFLILPAAAGLAALALPVVELLFAHGAFGNEAARTTALTLAAFAAGLPAMALTRILVAAWHGRELFHVPMCASLVALAAFLACAPLLLTALGPSGLALASAGAAWLNAALLAAWLGRDARVLLGVARAAVPMLGLGACVGLGAWGAWHYAPQGFKAATLALIPVWAVAYVLAARALGSGEAALVLSLFRRGKAR